jgi:TonB family protein
MVPLELAAVRQAMFIMKLLISPYIVRIRVITIIGFALFIISSCAPTSSVVNPKMAVRTPNGIVYLAQDTLSHHPSLIEKVPPPPEFLRRRKNPIYPKWARKEGVEADVFVVMQLSKDGTVYLSYIYSTTEEGFNFSALEAAMEYEFNYTSSDSSSNTWVYQPFKFRLRR